MISVEYSEALVEVLEIIKFLQKDDLEKIPKELIDYYQENKSTTYQPIINYEEDTSKLNLKNKTREILAGIYLDYLCEEEDKSEYRKKLMQNEMIHQKELKMNFQNQDIFKNKKNDFDDNIKKELIEIKKIPWYVKLVNKIKSVFKK